MKKTFKYITVLFLTILVSSCGNDWLNLEKDDSFTANPTDLTVANLVSMKIGMYNAIQYSEMYYGAKMIYDGDVRGDDFQYKEQGSSRADDSFVYSYALNNAEGCWKHAYYLIKTANAIIAAQPKDAVAANQKDIDDIKGQAYMLRALAHFDLLRNYGEFYNIDSKWGIPIVDRVIPGSELATNKPKRSTVKQVYDQIVLDLKGDGDKNPGAIKLMYASKTLGFVNAWAAKALLCRVYLYMGENEECLKLANDIINNSVSDYQLWRNADYLSSWSKIGHSEALFEIVNTSEDNLGREGIGYLMYPSGGYGYGDIVATLQYANLFEDGDVRKGLFFEDTEAKDNASWKGKKIFVLKYPGTKKSPSGVGNDATTTSIQVLRLSEVYLNAAEAAQKLGDSQVDALLTSIVQRANPAAPAVTGANLERVLLERRKELGGEGFRFYDALRNNKTMYRDNVAEYMKEIDASGVTVVVPANLQEDNEKLHPSLNADHKAIDRNHKKIIYPIPPRELNVINIDEEILIQYPTW